MGLFKKREEPIKPEMEDLRYTRKPLGRKTIVEGRTLDQWEEEGERNNRRPASQRVHPTINQSATRAQREAWAESLSSDEVLNELGITEKRRKR